MRKRAAGLVISAGLALWDAASLALALERVTGDLRAALANPWIVIFAGGTAAALAIDRAYTSRGVVSRVDETFRVARAVTVGTLSLVLVSTIFQLALPAGPRGIVKVGALFLLLSVPVRWFLRTVQKFLFRYRIGTRRTVIAGSADRAAAIAGQIAARPGLGFEVVGYLADSPGGEVAGVPTVGTALEEIAIRLEAAEADDVILALDVPDQAALLQLIASINGAPVQIQILPDMYEAVAGLARTRQVYGLPLIHVNPEIMTPWMRARKRALDLAFALVVGLVTAPLMLIIALLVRLTSSGPAIFSQERVGYRGRHFIMHKFRTMLPDAEEGSGPVWARPDDPRITPLGRILRRSRLDELPQIWNILRGDMSLVGPRPERPHFVSLLRQEFAYYQRRLQVRPGLTGWAQIRGKYDNSLDDVRSKLKDDLFYIENLSLTLDLKIMLLTLKVILRGQGQ